MNPVIVENESNTGPAEWLLSFDGNNPRDGYFFKCDDARDAKEKLAQWQRDNSVDYLWEHDGGFTFRWIAKTKLWELWETPQYGGQEYKLGIFFSLPAAIAEADMLF